ncbi:MAG TPA: hypothetical protein VMS74_08870 [Acidimicrobiia bacterium]|nr:hypothetical protein [Acidimicrobiia bacterium]
MTRQDKGFSQSPPDLGPDGEVGRVDGLAEEHREQPMRTPEGLVALGAAG